MQWGLIHYTLRPVPRQRAMANARACGAAERAQMRTARRLLASRAMTDRLTATIQTRANVYFDGRCVSHSIELADGSRKSVGVILPSTLSFKTGAPEVMELVDGTCRVRLPGSDAWAEYRGGQSFEVPGDSSFDIEVTQTLHYVCHFG